MSTPTVQITYILEEAERKRRLSPRQMLEISALPYSLKLPGAGKIFTLECEEHGILLSPANGMDICLNVFTTTALIDCRESRLFHVLRTKKDRRQFIDGEHQHTSGGQILHINDCNESEKRLLLKIFQAEEKEI